MLTPQWDGTDAGHESIVMVPDRDHNGSVLRVVTDGSFLRLVVVDGTGTEGAIGVSITSWMAGEPHVVTATWGEGSVQLYSDGQLVGQANTGGGLQVRPGAPVDGSFGAHGTITDVHAFNRPLTPDEVASLLDRRTLAPINQPTPAVVLNVRAAPLNGDAASVCVALEGGDGVVAGTQNDLVWDIACLTLMDECRARPQLGKDVVTARTSAGRLRALAFSLTDTAPMHDGVLYCCPFRLTAPSGCCALSVEAALASSSIGEAIATPGGSGEVCSTGSP